MHPPSKDEKPGLVLPMTFELEDGRTCILRAVTEDDAEALCQLLPALDRETDCLNRFPGEFDKTVEQERAFIRETTEIGNGIFLVVESAGRIVAIGGASAQKLRRFGHHREFGLAVLEAFWHQGIGRRLTAAIIEWARCSGLRKLTLKVFEHNRRAIATYQSYGFVEEGRLAGDVLRANGPYGDTILMAKFFEHPSRESADDKTDPRSV